MTDWRMTVFDILAFPAHCWIWLCAKLVGAEFWWGRPEDEPDNNENTE